MGGARRLSVLVSTKRLGRRTRDLKCSLKWGLKEETRDWGKITRDWLSQSEWNREEKGRAWDLTCLQSLWTLVKMLFGEKLRRDSPLPRFLTHSIKTTLMKMESLDER